MADQSESPPLEPRLPTKDDLLHLCRRLNEEGARYLVVGGWAMIQLGLGRTTNAIDLLVESSPENIRRLKAALASLPDDAAREVAEDDLEKFVVVRVNDAFTIDLMKAACGIEFAEASPQIQWQEIEGVRIPFASPRLMWRMKQTYREKDAYDRLFLTGLLNPPS